MINPNPFDFSMILGYREVASAGTNGFDTTLQ